MFVDIPEFEGLYAISKLGEIWSHKTNAKLKPIKLKIGYTVVNLHKNRKRHVLYIHRLVMRTFVGPCPKGMNVNHKNGIKADNRLQNLEYLTYSDNEKHAYKFLKKIYPAKKGIDQWRHKFTEQDILKIRQLYKEGIRQPMIAKIYNCTQPAISAITTRKNWKHI